MKVAEHKTSVTLIFAKNFGRPKAAFGLYLCLKISLLYARIPFQNLIDCCYHCVVKKDFQFVIILQGYLSLFREYLQKFSLDF